MSQAVRKDDTPHRTAEFVQYSMEKRLALFGEVWAFKAENNKW